MSIWMCSRSAELDLGILQISLQMQVRTALMSNHEHSLTIRLLSVADLTVLLALMAGRNVKETMGVVNAGLVRIAFFPT